MTTIPSRLTDQRLKRTLEGLNNQTYRFDKIYLTLPKFSARLNTPYPPIPQELLDYCEPVYIEKDYGPITKILGGLIKESDPNTIIITCDDDIIYPNTLVEEFLKRHQISPNSVLCFSGLTMGQFPGYISIVLAYDIFRYGWWFNLKVDPVKGRSIDILFGYGGALYLRKFFPLLWSDIKLNLLQYGQQHHDLFHHDDVMLSAYLSSQHIERRVFNAPFIVTNQMMNNALSKNDYFNLSFHCAFFRAISQSKHLFRSWQSVDHLNTVTGGLIYILLIIILAIIMYYYWRKSST